MPFTIDLSGVEAWKGSAILSPGTHNVHCIDAEEGRSKNGHPELHLTWEAMDGPEKGGTIQDWVAVTTATLGKVRQMLEACQMPVSGEKFELSAQSFMGRYCAIVAREKPKPDGTPKTEIVAYQRISDLGSNQAAGFEKPAAVAAAAQEPPPF